MGIGLNKKMVDSLGGDLSKATKMMSNNMNILFEHIKQVEENQVEFEQYLKKILENQKKLNDNIKE